MKRILFLTIIVAVWFTLPATAGEDLPASGSALPEGVQYIHEFRPSASRVEIPNIGFADRIAEQDDKVGAEKDRRQTTAEDIGKATPAISKKTTAGDLADELAEGSEKRALAGPPKSSGSTAPETGPGSADKPAKTKSMTAAPTVSPVAAGKSVTTNILRKSSNASKPAKVRSMVSGLSTMQVEDNQQALTSAASAIQSLAENQGPVEITVVAGDNQMGLVRSWLRTPVRIRVSRRIEQVATGSVVMRRVPAKQEKVVFLPEYQPAGAAGYAVAPQFTETDAQGYAECSVFLGNKRGRYTMTVSVGDKKQQLSFYAREASRYGLTTRGYLPSLFTPKSISVFGNVSFAAGEEVQNLELLSEPVYADIKRQKIAYLYPIWDQVLGIGIDMRDFGSFATTTMENGLISESGTKRYAEQDVYLSYSKKLLDRLSLGVSWKMLGGGVSGTRGYGGYGLSLSGTYYDDEHLAIAVHLADIVSSRAHDDKDDVLPARVTAGGMYELTDDIIAEAEIANRGRGYSSKLALEYFFSDYVAFGGGLFWLPLNINEYAIGSTFGVGLRLMGFNLDCSYVTHPELPFANGMYFSMGMSWGDLTASDRTQEEVMKKEEIEELLYDPRNREYIGELLKEVIDTEFIQSLSARIQTMAVQGSGVVLQDNPFVSRNAQQQVPFVPDAEEVHFLNGATVNIPESIALNAIYRVPTEGANLVTPNIADFVNLLASQGVSVNIPDAGKNTVPTASFADKLAQMPPRENELPEKPGNSLIDKIAEGTGRFQSVTQSAVVVGNRQPEPDNKLQNVGDKTVAQQIMQQFASANAGSRNAESQSAGFGQKPVRPAPGKPKSTRTPSFGFLDMEGLDEELAMLEGEMEDFFDVDVSRSGDADQRRQQQENTIRALSMITYSDISEKDWGYREVMLLTRLGIVEGYPKGVFMPYNFMTREEITLVLERLRNLNISDRIVKITLRDSNKKNDLVSRDEMTRMLQEVTQFTRPAQNLLVKPFLYGQVSEKQLGYATLPFRFALAEYQTQFIEYEYEPGVLDMITKESLESQVQLTPYYEKLPDKFKSFYSFDLLQDTTGLPSNVYSQDVLRAQKCLQQIINEYPVNQFYISRAEVCVLLAHSVDINQYIEENKLDLEEFLEKKDVVD